MARDSSPIAQRLKALAQRAGLPVDDRPATPAPTPPRPQASTPPPDDEQPTGEIPRVADPDEQPTGEVPALVAEAEPTAEPESADVPEPAAEPELEASQVETGPSLRPPVIPPKLQPVEPPATSFPEPTPEPEEPVLEPLAAAEPAPEPLTVAEPTPTQATDIWGGQAEPWADEPAPQPEPEPVSEAPAPEPHADEQPTTVSPALGTAPAPEPESEPAKKATILSLTGRFPALRKRRSEATSEPAAEQPAPVATIVAEPAAPEPELATPEPIAAAAMEQSPGALPAKPSFAERAALRRRARTLRARRDAGLLELGAIVLDLRRFGDPTAGALQRRRTDELADLDNEISAIEQVIDQDSPTTAVAQLGTVRCANCTSLVGPSDRFCAQCGTPRPDASLAVGSPPSK